MKYFLQANRCIVFMLFSLLLPGCGGCRKGPSPGNSFSDPDVIALAKAAERDDVKEIDRLVAKGVNINTKGTQKEQTPLFFAFNAGKKKAFEALLKHGADPNVISRTFIGSVVHAAAEKGDDSEWLEMALKYGGDPNVENPHGVGAPLTPLWEAIFSRNDNNVQLLLDAGANINFQDSTGNTPVMYAVSIRHYRTTHMLLESGADWKIKNEHGQNLAFACYLHYMEHVKESPEDYEYFQKVLKFLKEKGVDLEDAKKKADKHMGRSS